MLPHKALSPGFEEDIFINYSHVDNATVEEKNSKGLLTDRTTRSQNIFVEN